MMRGRTNMLGGRNAKQDAAVRNPGGSGAKGTNVEL
jgi:hypothetical protein